MFKLAKVQGKGIGWVSTRSIPPQTLILDEAPIFSICKDPSPSDISLKLGKLDSSQCKKWTEFCSGQNPSETVLRYGLGLTGETEESIGIFQKCSRLNHSCRPNAVAAWGEGSMSIQAIDFIEKESEITISYLTDPMGSCRFEKDKYS
jgi:hypothetical protein